MDPDDGLEEEEGPFLPWLPPDDRLWRHPSEAIEDGRSEDTGSLTLETLAARDSRSQLGRIWTVALVAGVIGALAASGVGMVTGAFEHQTTVMRPVVQSPTVSLASSTAAGVDWTSVDNAIASSVVQIDVSNAAGSQSGSGLLFIYGGNYAYVITAYSLTQGGGQAVVTYPSGDQANATIVGEDSVTGLALLEVPDLKASFPNLGSVADLPVASPVMAVAARSAPVGSVFPGSVSAEDRAVDLNGGATMQNLIAISSPGIPSAAAGGPVVDRLGRVVGITISLDPADSVDQGLSYAVPVDVAEHVAEQILASAQITHPWLGISNAEDLSTVVAHQYGLQGGAQVGSVEPGSPASRIGLESRDIITALNGVPVTSSGALVQDLFLRCEPGNQVTIAYLHLGKPAQATFYVSNQPPDNS